eukprot:gene19821-12354_t
MAAAQQAQAARWEGKGEEGAQAPELQMQMQANPMLAAQMQRVWARPAAADPH